MEGGCIWGAFGRTSLQRQTFWRWEGFGWMERKVGFGRVVEMLENGEMLIAFMTVKPIWGS
jgi:hypothetical protein